MAIVDKWAEEWERRRKLRADMGALDIKVIEHTDMESRDYERDVEHFYCLRCGFLLSKRVPPVSEHAHDACFIKLAELVQDMRRALVRRDLVNDLPFDHEDDF